MSPTQTVAMGPRWFIQLFLAITLLTLTPLPSWSDSENSSDADHGHLPQHSSLLSNSTAFTTHHVASRSGKRAPFIQDSSLSTNQFIGTVVRVLDGDTIEVLHEGRGAKVRLAEIDCPEKSQAFGQRAKQFTSELVFGKEVTVQVLEFDRNRRMIGKVRLLDGTSLNRELVSAGLAWWYRNYSHDQSIGELETSAMAVKRGLWADPDPIPPWEFRKSKRH